MEAGDAPAHASSLRDLPSVEQLASRLDAPHALAVPAARAAIAAARDALRAGEEVDVLAAAREHLDAAERPTLRRVLNATGVIVHTNLGRAPLPAAAREAAAAAGTGYSTLEYDLERGARGSRQAHVAQLVRELTGAEAALAVNNGAAAVLLAAAALAGPGREVVVSRGELVEIGGSFRIPDVIAQSGSTLVEVGTTNRTKLADYVSVLRPETRAILRVHQSNFRIVGFTAHPGLGELAEVAGGDVALIDDLGSGALLDLPDLLDEPTARASVEAGADLVCFSGDKLLGGPQAGIIVGTAEAVGRVKRHPLARAMRIDKLSLAALEATLELYRNPAQALAQIPVLRSLGEPAERVRERAERLCRRLGGELTETTAKVGGGALPLLELDSFACALEGGDELAARLREGDPPVVARVQEGRVLLDCRTLSDEDCDLIRP